MELKPYQTTQTKTARRGSNRTFMELKLDDKGVICAAPTVLIVPLWN